MYPGRGVTVALHIWDVEEPCKSDVLDHKDTYSNSLRELNVVGSTPIMQLFARSLVGRA